MEKIEKENPVIEILDLENPQTNQKMLNSIILNPMETAQDFANDESMPWLPAELWLYIFGMNQQEDDAKEKKFLDEYFGRDEFSYNIVSNYLKSLDGTFLEKYETLCAWDDEQHYKIRFYKSIFKCLSIEVRINNLSIPIKTRRRNMENLVRAFENIIYDFYFYAADQMIDFNTNTLKGISRRIDLFQIDFEENRDVIGKELCADFERRVYEMLFFVHVYYPYMRFHDTSNSENFRKYFYGERDARTYLIKNQPAKPQQTPFQGPSKEWPQFPITDKKELRYIKELCDEYTIKMYDPEYYYLTYMNFTTLRNGKRIIPKGGIPTYRWHCDKLHRIHAPLLE